MTIDQIVFRIADALFWAAPWPRGPISSLAMRVMHWPAKRLFKATPKTVEFVCDEPPDGCFWYSEGAGRVAVPLEYSASPGEWLLRQELMKRLKESNQ